MTIIERGITVAEMHYPMHDGNRYELIGGDVHVTTQPHPEHQRIMCLLYMELATWSTQHGAGTAYIAPDVIFSARDAVVPDVVWVSAERAPAIIDLADGKLYGAPDLVIEILSRGRENERRYRETKRDLYDRFGVDEYWIIDRFARQVAVYWRVADQLQRVAQLGNADTLASPLLPDFTCPIASMFEHQTGAARIPSAWSSGYPGKITRIAPGPKIG